MKTYRIGVLAVAALSLANVATAATLPQNAIAYSLGDGGRTLVTVASPAGGAVSGVGLTFAGGFDVTLDGIAYRPKTRQLYGYDNAGATMYAIDVATGAATAVVTEPGVTTTDALGLDFNNVLDAARIVTAADENVVFFPNKVPPTLEPKTPLFYGMGDANEGKDAIVAMNAYTNAVPNPTSTLQYAIDSNLDTLTTLANNAGTLTTVGDLFFGGNPFDVDTMGGFDILSFFSGDNSAYALLTGSAGQSIYSVPLIADMQGRINLEFVANAGQGFGALNSFAVAPVPVPPAFGLMVLALGGLGFLRRRKAA